MTDRERLSRAANPTDVESVIQTVRFAGLKLLAGAWKHGELPDCFEPIEFGSFFVSFTRP